MYRAMLIYSYVIVYMQSYVIDRTSDMDVLQEGVLKIVSEKNVEVVQQ